MPLRDHGPNDSLRRRELLSPKPRSPAAFRWSSGARSLTFGHVIPDPVAVAYGSRARLRRSSPDGLSERDSPRMTNKANLSRTETGAPFIAAPSTPIFLNC